MLDYGSYGALWMVVFSIQEDVVFDAVIENRIEDQIIVDAYNEYEQAMGWLTYLTDQLSYPFQAKCIKIINSSPLTIDEVTMVTGMDNKLCEHDMFVTVKWQDRSISVPLSQLEGIDVDDETRQGIADWHYRLNSGRSLV